MYPGSLTCPVFFVVSPIPTVLPFNLFSNSISDSSRCFFPFGLVKYGRQSRSLIIGNWHISLFVGWEAGTGWYVVMKTFRGIVDATKTKLLL